MLVSKIMCYTTTIFHFKEGEKVYGKKESRSVDEKNDFQKNG